MTNDLFCPDCGMLKKNCTCSNKKQPSHNHKKTQVFDYTHPVRRPGKEPRLNTQQIQELIQEYPEIDDEIIENFPFPTPRKGQLEIIQDVYQAINNDYKYIVLEAGTGTGKSAIATTLARIFEPAYILTMTKQLQRQYSEEFALPLVKGRGNFNCLFNDLETTCDMGTCQTTASKKDFNCPHSVTKKVTDDEAFEDSKNNPLFFKSDEHCTYWHQKVEGINAPITLMNYDYALLELNYVKHFPKRDIMILDEAHNIENKLMTRLEVNLYHKRLTKDIKRKLTHSTLKSTLPEDWLLEIDSLKDAYEDIDIADLPKNKADRIKRQILTLKRLHNNLKTEPRNWVITQNETGVSFKPLKIDKYAQKQLFQYADTCIFMSATILSHKLFCKWLGIKEKDVYFIKVDSPFPVHQRPIELSLAGKMSKNRIKRTAPNTIPILNKILKRHENDKGLIHTHSYQCQNYIQRKIHNPRLLTHNSENRDRILQHFELSKNPLVLVSPSMSEGVDLPYEKCRFQIIYKVPFPYLGDRQIDLRRKKEIRWYAYKTVMTLMQAYGRGMRAEDDSCYTYVLDENINMLFTSPLYRSLVPEFFKEAIITKEDISLR